MVSLLGFLLLLSPAGVSQHPMHTAVTQISYDASTGAANLQLRVFMDDLAAAVGNWSNSVAVRQYLAGKVSLLDRSGRPLALRWIGLERSGDVVLIRLAATIPNGLSGVKVNSTVLCERFADQVNVVRASWESHTTTLLFTRGDGMKSL